MPAIRSRKAALGGTLAAAIACPLLLAGQTTAQQHSAAAAAAPVTITGTSSADYRFQPRRLTVKKGARVRWSWQSNAPHNVTFADGKHSATGDYGSFKRSFKRSGTFKYVCTVHDFSGKIVVRK